MPKNNLDDVDVEKEHNNDVVPVEKPLAVFYAYDDDQVKRYAHATDLFGVVWSYLNEALRSQSKWGAKKFASPEAALEWAQSELTDALNEAGINLDDLWR